MKSIFLIVGAVALAASMPALAKGPHGKGGSKNTHSMGAKHGGKSKAGSHSRFSAKAYKVSSKADGRSKMRTAGLTDTNGDGRVNSRDVLDRNLDGADDRTGKRYGGAACPPGLAKKTPACVPPGQARRQFAEGQRIPNSYNAFTQYNALPDIFRSQVPYSSNNQYLYQNNQVYAVDRATRVVRTITNLIR